MRAPSSASESRAAAVSPAAPAPAITIRADVLVFSWCAARAGSAAPAVMAAMVERNCRLSSDRLAGDPATAGALRSKGRGVLIMALTCKDTIGYLFYTSLY